MKYVSTCLPSNGKDLGSVIPPMLRSRGDFDISFSFSFSSLSACFISGTNSGMWFSVSVMEGTVGASLPSEQRKRN